MLREEIAARLEKLALGEFKEGIFADIRVRDDQRDALVSSLCAGHHILILGPPGCGKTVLATRICDILGEIEVVPDCPLNCPPQDPRCPWCIEAGHQGPMEGEILPAGDRIKRVQGSDGLTPEDLIGDLDVEMALSRGIHSPGAFVPGKLLRANRGILLIDFIDRVPPRVLNVILSTLQGDAINIGTFDEVIPLDILVVATGSERAFHTLPLDLVECFDVVTLDYVASSEDEKHLVAQHLQQGSKEGMLPPPAIEQVVNIVRETRTHMDVERGVSTRGAIRYAEVLAHSQELEEEHEEKWLRLAALTSLPHRLLLAPEADLEGKREDIINDIVDRLSGVETEKEMVTLSKEQILDLVVEIVSKDDFRQPLKYGDFGLLLARVRRFPESKLAQAVREAMARLQELYPERFRSDNLTQELLKDLEATRKRELEIMKIARELEAEALAEVLGLLESKQVLQRGARGWELSQRGLIFFLEKLEPRVWQAIYSCGYGKHSTGRKLSSGEGRVVGLRRYRFGDRYRDVSFTDTVRQAVRNRRNSLTKEDIMVTIKDIRAKIDIVLVVDLSGTMYQLDKFWYAKESAIALSLAATRSGDRVGIVSFSNLSDVVVDITTSPHSVTKHVIDLEVHRNAFTNIGSGLLKARELFARHRRGRASQHIILVSDGDATAPHPSPQKYALRQAARAARRGITISCVCINRESTDPELMRRIAKVGKGRMYFVGPEGLTDALLAERYAASFPY